MDQALDNYIWEQYLIPLGNLNIIEPVDRKRYKMVQAYFQLAQFGRLPNGTKHGIVHCGTGKARGPQSPARFTGTSNIGKEKPAEIQVEHYRWIMTQRYLFDSRVAPAWHLMNSDYVEV